MNEDYIRRINLVLNYIEDNLDGELSLETISGVACYSTFHLHRLFKAITNETVNAYITRKRIEKAAIQLIHRNENSILDIANQTGFNSNSSFTRTFQKIYGQSPSRFREINKANFSKISKTDSKNGKINYITDEYLCHISNLKKWMNMNAKVEIKDLPEMKVAYVTHIGVDGLEKAFARILKWAGPKGLLAQDSSNVVRIFHDSFKITDENKVRMSIGITVPDSVREEGEVGLSRIEKGKHLTGRFEIEPKEFENAWNSLFLYMSEKGYKKSDQNPFEIYYNNMNEHPEGKCIVDLCIQVL